jgi:hypothetical protein
LGAVVRKILYSPGDWALVAKPTYNQLTKTYYILFWIHER